MEKENELRNFIEFDKQTQERVNVAHQMKIDVKRQIVEEKEKIKKDAWDDVNKRVADEKIKLDESVNIAFKNSEIELSECKKQLENKYNDSKEQWIDEIMNHCIGE